MLTFSHDDTNVETVNISADWLAPLFHRTETTL